MFPAVSEFVTSNLAIIDGEKCLFFASFSMVNRVLKARDLMTARGPGGRHNARSLIPVRKELSGHNQRWCWDTSFLMTLEKGVNLYLYLLPETIGDFPGTNGVFAPLKERRTV